MEKGDSEAYWDEVKYQLGISQVIVRIKEASYFLCIF